MVLKLREKIMKYLTIILLALSDWLLDYQSFAVEAAASSATLQSVMLDKCPESVLEQYDLDIAKLMTIGYRQWPETFQESKGFCAETRRLNEKINNFKSRCPSGTAKEFTSVIVYSIQRQLKTYCVKQPNKKVLNFFKSNVCTNRATNHTSKCVQTYVNRLQAILKVQAKHQMAHACCQYYELLRCFEKAYEKFPGCSDSAETFTNFVRQVFDDIVNLTCQDYNEASDKCDHLGALPSKDPKMKRTKSFLLPLIDIWANLDKNAQQ